MLDFMAAQYGAISIAIICFSLLVIIFRLTGKNSGVEVDLDDKKLKIGRTTTHISAVDIPKRFLITMDDWKRFSDELYEFCFTLMKPDAKHWYSILHCYDNSISPSKKSYVERFLYFNHIPEKSDKKYYEYVSTHAEALIRSVCRDIKFITGEYDKDVPSFDARSLGNCLSGIIEKYRH
jgi:hypothetical protein